MVRTITPELQEVYEQLKNEGFEVYTYTCESNKNEEITSLYWFENGRVLDIQPSSWYNKKYNSDCFNLSVAYFPSRENGSGYLLSPSDWGMMAKDLLKYRKNRALVNSINYTSMENFLKHQGKILRFHKVEEE